MKQSVFYYCAFAVIVLGSVLFGLDWQSATLSPMAPIQVVALPPPPPAPVIVTAPVAAPPIAVAPAAPRPAAPANPPVAQTPPKPLCDIVACAAAYRSFRASDCTYNPSFGARQLCTKGVVPIEAATTRAAPVAPDTQSSIMQTEPNARTNAQPAQPNTPPNPKCNVSACAAAYRTFTESDCSFLATGGQRKLCTK
jgi:hypothetical protein